ncbi:MAG: hypothetical protein QM477_07240 [Planctomycetota bacterium]
MALSFASSMGTQIQIARDQAATLHADLAAQSGLEYAQRRLLIDPLWDGTFNGPLLYAEGTTFTIVRKAGKASVIMPSEVSLIVEGNQSASRARFETMLYVNPGDPLLDKAVSILGNVTGSNIKIDGDYLILDAKGWLWDFRIDLIPEVQTDPRLTRTEKRDVQVKLDALAVTEKGNTAEVSEHLDDHGEQGHSDISGVMESVSVKDSGEKVSSSVTASIEELLLHIRKTNYLIEGVWARSAKGEETFIALDRLDAPGALHNFSQTLYSWAEKQIQEKQPVHAPGWDFSDYLIPHSKIRIFDHITQVQDLDIEETAIFLLNEGDQLNLKNVHFHGGLVVWVENEYDYTGAPRNPVLLSGSNSFGGGSGGLNNIGILAPGSSLEVEKLGAAPNLIEGYSVIHSLTKVRRLQHLGVLIILNSATDVFDSSFTFDPVISASPPESILFFGDLPGVRVAQVIESFDALPAL